MSQISEIKIKTLIQPELDSGGLGKAVKSIQDSLSSLKLPKELETKFVELFQSYNKQIDKINEKFAAGFKTKGDVSGVTKLGSELTGLMRDFSTTFKSLEKFDLGDLVSISPSILKDINTLNDEIKQTETQLVDIAKSAIPGIDEAVKKLTGAGAKTVGNQIMTILGSGDPTSIQKAQAEVEKAIKRRNGSAEGSTKQLDRAQFVQISDELLRAAEAQKALNDHIDELNVQKEEKLAEATEEASKSVKDLKESTDRASSSSVEFNRNIKESSTKTAEFSQSIEQLKDKAKYFFSLNNAVQLVKRTIQSAYQDIKELDAAFTETAVVTEKSVSDMWGMLDEYTAVAKELGATTVGVAQTLTLFYQQGLNDAEAMQLGTETLKMARIAGLDYATATDYMTAALRGFNMELDQTSAQNVNDVYSELAAITAADTQEIAVAMTKVASLAHNANMEFETTAAFLAQIVETTRESAETAGTALKTVIARFSEVKSAYSQGDLIASTEEGEEIDVNKVSTALRTAGIDLNEYLAGAKGLDDIFMELAQKWDSLDDVQQRYIATMAAGSRQQSRFIALMSDYDRTVELVNTTNNSAGASQDQFNKTLDSLESKLNILKDSWQEFSLGIMNSGLIKWFVDAANAILGFTNKISNLPGALGSASKSFLLLGGLFTGKKLIKVLEQSTFADAAARVMGKAGEAGGVSFLSALKKEFSGVKKIFDKDTWTKALEIPEIPKDATKNIENALDNLIKEQNEKLQNLYNTGDYFTYQTETFDVFNQIPDKAQELEKFNQLATQSQLEYNAAIEAGASYQQAWNILQEKGNGETLESILQKKELKDVDQAALETKWAQIAAESQEQAVQNIGLLTKAKYIASVLFSKKAVEKDAAGHYVNAAAIWLEAKAKDGSTLAQWALNASLYACPLGWILAGIVAIIAAVTALVVIYNKYFSQAARIEQAAEMQDFWTDKVNETKEAYESLSDTLDGLDDKYDKIKEMAVGTSDWRMAVSKLNSEIRDLIENYGLIEEKDYTIDENGVYSLTESGKEKSKGEAFDNYIKAKKNSAVANAAYNTETLNQAHTQVGEAMGYQGTNNQQAESGKKFLDSLGEDAKVLFSELDTSKIKQEITDDGYYKYTYDASDPNAEKYNDLFKKILDGITVLGENTAKDRIEVVGKAAQSDWDMEETNVTKFKQEASEIAKLGLSNQEGVNKKISDQLVDLVIDNQIQPDQASSRGTVTDTKGYDLNTASQIEALAKKTMEDKYGSEENLRKAAADGEEEAIAYLEAFEKTTEKGNWEIDQDRALYKMLYGFDANEKWNKDTLQQAIADYYAYGEALDDATNKTEAEVKSISDAWAGSSEETVEQLQILLSAGKLGYEELSKAAGDGTYTLDKFANSIADYEQEHGSIQITLDQMAVSNAKAMEEQFQSSTSRILELAAKKKELTKEEKEEYDELIASLSEFPGIYDKNATALEEWNSLSDEGSLTQHNYLLQVQFGMNKKTEEENQRLLNDSLKGLKEYETIKKHSEMGSLTEKEAVEFDKLKNQVDDLKKTYLEAREALQANPLEIEVDVNGVLDYADAIKNALSTIDDGFKANREAFQGLMQTFPEVLEGAQVLSDGTIQLNEENVKSTIETKKAEVLANTRAVSQEIQDKISQAKIEQAAIQETANFFADSSVQNALIAGESYNDIADTASGSYNAAQIAAGLAYYNASQEAKNSSTDQTTDAQAVEKEQVDASRKADAASYQSYYNMSTYASDYAKAALEAAKATKAAAEGNTDVTITTYRPTQGNQSNYNYSNAPTSNDLKNTVGEGGGKDYDDFISTTIEDVFNKYSTLNFRRISDAEKGLQQFVDGLQQQADSYNTIISQLEAEDVLLWAGYNETINGFDNILNGGNFEGKTSGSGSSGSSDKSDKKWEYDYEPDDNLLKEKEAIQTKREELEAKLDAAVQDENASIEDILKIKGDIVDTYLKEIANEEELKELYDSEVEKTGGLIDTLLKGNNSDLKSSDLYTIKDGKMIRNQEAIAGLDLSDEEGQKLEKYLDDIERFTDESSEKNANILDLQNELFEVLKGTESVFDDLYDLNRRLEKLQNEREKLENRYNEMLAEDSTVVADLYDNLVAQKENIEKQKANNEASAIAADKKLADFIGSNVNSKYAGYVSYDTNTKELSIDYSSIEKLALADEETYAMVEEFVNTVVDYYDEMTSYEEAVAENTQELVEHERAMRDAASQEYQTIYDAISSRIENELQTMEEISNGIDDSNSKLLDSMQKSIDQQRQARDNAKTEDELNRKRNQLAFLQMDTSGANGSQILSLEKEISEAEVDYTDTLIDQKISELQEQNDMAAEQREREIELLNWQFNEAVESGKIAEVAQELLQKIVDTGSAGEVSISTTLENVFGKEGKDGTFTSFITNAFSGEDNNLQKLIEKANNNKTLSWWEQKDWEDEQKELVAQTRTFFEQYKKANAEALSRGEEVELETGDGRKVKGISNGDGTVSVYSNDGYRGTFDAYLGADNKWHSNQKWTQAKGTGGYSAADARLAMRASVGLETLTGEEKRYLDYDEDGSVTAADSRLILRAAVGLEASKNPAWFEQAYNLYKNGQFDAADDLFYKNVNHYATGGLADYTGPAWLDGTKSRPELVLNQKDTENFIQLKDILARLMSNLKYSNSSDGNGGDNYYEIHLNVEKITSDYDVEKLANKVKKIIADDANSRGVNSIYRKR